MEVWKVWEGLSRPVRALRQAGRNYTVVQVWRCGGVCGR